MVKINPKRLIRDLQKLRSFGANGKGVVRQSLSDQDVESRKWLYNSFTDAGLHANIDGVGNVFGIMKSKKRAILTGSHTDTTPEGGWLDGTLGVIYGLEIARSLTESKYDLDIGLDVVSWMDEEGTYSDSIGSRSFCNQLAENEIETAKNRNGELFIEALERHNYKQNPREILDKNRYVAYLEAHIEQGAVLESERKRIGVVNSIVGAREFTVEFRGEQNHAGTTPMYLRKDAAMAMIEFAAELNSRFHAAADNDIVWTFGRIVLKPNTPSAIPESAQLSVQFRCGVEATLDTFEEEMNLLLKSFSLNQERILTSCDEVLRFYSSPMNSDITNIIEMTAARSAKDDWKIMPSGAGHDAQFLTTEIPTGMMFIPSIGGVSHSFDEDTDEADIILGCQVFADAIVNVMSSDKFS